MIYLKDPNLFIEAHISDLHFGVFDPRKQYEILHNQFTQKLIPIMDKLDIISINGDLFHHRFMGNSDAIMYCLKFIDELVSLCRQSGTVLFIIHGTPSHDANQTKLFYRYMNDPTVDVRVIETVKFEYVRNKRILCIPEVPGLGKDFYEDILYFRGPYDAIYMHGTIKGAVFGKNEIDLDAPSPVFGMDVFTFLKGPVISGHIHVPGCYESHFYYCGSPYRWCYGEEQPKGFILLTHNIKTKYYYVHFEEINSFRYDTINMDDMINSNPQELIDRVERLRAQGIDNIRLEFTREHENINIIQSYYRNTSNVAFKCDYRNDMLKKSAEEALNKYTGYSYVMDKNLSAYDILAKYINQNKGYAYITSEELIDILKE